MDYPNSFNNVAGNINKDAIHKTEMQIPNKFIIRDVVFNSGGLLLISKTAILNSYILYYNI